MPEVGVVVQKLTELLDGRAIALVGRRDELIEVSRVGSGVGFLFSFGLGAVDTSASPMAFVAAVSVPPKCGSRQPAEVLT